MEARSSSESSLKDDQYIGSESALPSCPIPSLIALAKTSSLQFPAPVFLSGVILGATIRDSFVSLKIAPAPFFDSMGGKPGFVVSRGEWQRKHFRILFVRYSPLLILSGVDLNFTSLN